MKKKVLTVFLALAMLLALAVPAWATDSEMSEAEEAAWALYELGLFKGTGVDKNGNPIFDLDKEPTREQGVTMLVRLLGKEEEALAGNWDIPFKDVPDWARPYVGYAYANGLTKGTSATTYDGKSPITVSQYLTFVLRSLGYTSETDFQWDKAWELTDKIGLTKGEYNAKTANFTRGDVAIISYNSLSIDPYVAVSGIQLSSSSLSMEVGDTSTLTATVSPDNATYKTVTWSSSDPAVATVMDGTVSAVSAGDAVITAETHTGETAQCQVTVTQPPKLGTITNPIPADGQSVISSQEYSFKPAKSIRVQLLKEIRGAEANALIKSENSFNTVPNNSQEWRVYEFQLTYVSCSDGSNTPLEASEVIYDDTFYTLTGAFVNVAKTASFSKNYAGYGVFDVKLYPGASGKVVVGILIPKDSGDLLLKVPGNEGKDVTWVKLSPVAGNFEAPTQSALSGTIPADGQSVISYQEYSFKPAKSIRVQLLKEIRGSEANALIKSENSFNTVPNNSQEWRVYEFQLTYVSCSDGSNTPLEASEVIYDDTFYTLTGASANVAKTASFSKNYAGYGVFDVKLYPGASGKVVIGILIPKDSGDLLLKVPGNEGKDVTWVKLSGAGSGSGTSTPGAGSTTPQTPSGSDIDFLVAYIDTYGQPTGSGQRYIEETMYTTDGTKYAVSIVHHSDKGILTFSWNYRNGSYFVGFDYDIGTQSAKAKIGVTGLGGDLLNSCRANFDISSYTPDTTLIFDEKTESPFLIPFPENYEEEANAAVQFAVAAWGLLILNETGITLDKIGFSNYIV